MTYRRDDQSFADTLDAAVREMHQQMPRGNGPSSRAWKSLTEQAMIPSNMTSQAEPRKLAPVPGSESITNHRRPASGNPRLATYLPWSTWAAVALVVILIGASVNFLMPESNGGNVSEQSIALAPVTPDLSMFPQQQVATPWASPDAAVPDFGPEYACHAEPLTEDQVFDMVINPSREYARRGSETHGSNLDKPREDYSWYTNQVHSIYTNELFQSVEDAESAQNLRELSNEFWNCLMTGTAFQVWGLMDPTNVQREILAHYPVLRDETLLRAHIELWGDLPYMNGLHVTFPDLEHWELVEAVLTADDSASAVVIMPTPFESQEHARARVTMLPHPEGTRWGDLFIQLEFVRAADGTWWATRVVFDSR